MQVTAHARGRIPPRVRQDKARASGLQAKGPYIAFISCLVPVSGLPFHPGMQPSVIGPMSLGCDSDRGLTEMAAVRREKH